MATNAFKEYDLANQPPEGDNEAVGKYAQELFEAAESEKLRLHLPEKWTHAYTLYRGDHWQRPRGAVRNKSKITVNLFFANVNRTVSNITARRPVVEVVDLERKGDGYDNLDVKYTAKLRKWWKDTKQQSKLKETALKMEKYGVTVERPYYDTKRNWPDVEILNSFAVFPAPGNWSNFDEDCPYFCFVYAQPVEIIEKEHGLEPGAVKEDTVYSTLGEYREDRRPSATGSAYSNSPESGNYEKAMSPVGQQGGKMLIKRALVVQLWIRDRYAIDKDGNKKYPDDIRFIKFTNKGELVLRDKRNPNINWALRETPEETLEVVKKTHAWGRIPFYKVNSYLDTTTPWGFSAVEQVGDLNKKVDEIMSRLFGWLNRVMYPPLVVAKETGITKNMINSKPNLVLMPEKVAHVAGIAFVQVPNLPKDFKDILNIGLTFFDRIYQIEDADRGVAPKGVIAASAIVALQERNAVLIQEKITAVDDLVENRGKWAISLYQNFGQYTEPIEAEGETVMFKGIDTAGRDMNFVVESGSTMPRTSLQLEEQAKALYEMNAIDRQALLEAVNFPNWKKIIERVGETQLDEALQILIQSGLPEEDAAELKEFLMQPQGGPGDQKKGTGSATGTAQAPRARQGAMPPGNVTQHPSVGRTA